MAVLFFIICLECHVMWWRVQFVLGESNVDEETDIWSRKVNAYCKHNWINFCNMFHTEAHKGHYCKYFSASFFLFPQVFFYFRKVFFLFPQGFFYFRKVFFISARFTYLRKVLFISARFVSFPQGYIISARFILFPQGYFYFPEVYFFSAKFALLPQRIFSVCLRNGQNHCVNISLVVRSVLYRSVQA